MKKILIVSSVSRQFYLFEQGNIEVLHSLGYEIHTAADFSDASDKLDELDIIRYQIDIQRNPYSLKNIKAYKQLKQIMKSEKFDVVHCHSPIGGVLARLAAKSVGISHVIYTAHGFHFYKGASPINWLIYYPVERFLARYTEVLITINQQDYCRAKMFKAKKVMYVPGIGVDTKKFSEKVTDRLAKRKEINISENAYVILSVGELNKNKNHKTIIKAVSKLQHPNICYIVCGTGTLEKYLKELAVSLGIVEQVKLLGFRNDVNELYHTADLFCFPSTREGLSVALLEAMACGLPIVCSSIRGNTDLIENGKGGYLLNPDDIDGFAEYIMKVINDVELSKSMGRFNIERVRKNDMSVVKEEMRQLYESIL